jgi:hypothetical protein
MQRTQHGLSRASPLISMFDGRFEAELRRNNGGLVAAPTPFDSAQLILKLYELRREPVLRQARAWFLSDFNPRTEEEFLTIAGGERNAWFRMVLGYWDMAASLVTHGAIDAAMFRAANTEIMATFAKVEPFLSRLREVSGIPEFVEHLERVVMGAPGAAERLALLREECRAASKREAEIVE